MDTSKQNLILQALGAAFGGLFGLLLANLFPTLAGRFGAVTFVLWMAVFGAVLTSLETFGKAGRAVTRSENTRLNTAVGISLSAVLLSAIAWLITRF